jgi:hypothetical protein
MIIFTAWLLGGLLAWGAFVALGLRFAPADELPRHHSVGIVFRAPARLSFESTPERQEPVEAVA